MTKDEVHALIMSFPGVTEGSSYGQPSYKLKDKFFTRLREADQSLVLMDVHIDEREMLMEAEPGVFHITAHYKDYPCVLARIGDLHPGSLQNMLDRRWRKIAPKTLVKARDAAG
jgi:hypothetical protein